MRHSLIFGGTKGIGRALSERLARHGRVSIAGRSGAAEARSDGDILHFPADVTDSAQVNAAIEKAVSEFGSLDWVVNSAGFGHCLALDEMTDSEWRQMCDVTVTGNFFIARAAYEQFKKQRHGHYLTIGSMASGGGWRMEIGYGTAKGAQAKFAMHLNDQFQWDREHGVGDFHTHVLCPGSVYTDFWKRVPQRTMTEAESLTSDEVAAAAEALLLQPGWSWPELKAHFPAAHLDIGPLPPFDRQPFILKMAHQAHP